MALPTSSQTATINPALQRTDIPTPHVPAFDMLMKAYDEGLIRGDDILNRLTVKPAEQRAKTAEANVRTQRAASEIELGPIKQKLDAAKMALEGADLEFKKKTQGAREELELGGLEQARRALKIAEENSGDLDEITRSKIKLARTELESKAAEQRFLGADPTGDRATMVAAYRQAFPGKSLPVLLPTDTEGSPQLDELTIQSELQSVRTARERAARTEDVQKRLQTKTSPEGDKAITFDPLTSQVVSSVKLGDTPEKVKTVEIEENGERTLLGYNETDGKVKYRVALGKSSAGKNEQEKLFHLLASNGLASEALDPVTKDYKSLPELAELTKKIPEKREPGGITFDVNAQSLTRDLGILKDTVLKFGNYENALVGNADAVAKLKSLPYQIAIAYAKIVDPESVAREGEVASAKKYMVSTGLWTRNAVTLSQIDNMLQTVNARTQMRSGVTGQPATLPATGPAPTKKAVVGTDARYPGKFFLLDSGIEAVKDASGNWVPAK